MNKILKFGTPRLLAKVATSTDILFPYSTIDESYLGTPEEQSKWEEKFITVKLTDALKACWNNSRTVALSADEVEKVMFEYGFRELVREANENGLPDAIEYTLFSHQIPQILEFNPTQIEKPDGSVRIIGVSRIIGFNMT